MGGAACAVSSTTRHVYVENRVLVARSHCRPFQALSIFQTDAGHRFERGVDPAAVVDRPRTHHRLDSRHLRRASGAGRRPGGEAARSESR